MLKRKRIRQKGKLGLSKVFSNISVGDKVALIRDLSFTASFPERFQGRTGTVIDKQGRSLVVLVKEGSMEKKFITQKIHLKKLSS